MSGFGGFVLRRAIGTALTLFAISVIVYVVFYVTPGNVAQITCGPRCSPEQVQQVAGQLRLDEPLYVRYWHFLEGLVGQARTTPRAPLWSAVRRPAWGCRTRATSRSPG